MELFLPYGRGLLANAPGFLAPRMNEVGENRQFEANQGWLKTNNWRNASFLIILFMGGIKKNMNHKMLLINVLQVQW